MKRLHGITIFFTLYAILFIGPSSFPEAAEWKVRPAFRLRGEVNDNFQLTAANKKSVFGVISTPSLGIDALSQKLKVSGNLSMNVNRYLGDQELNTTDYLLRVSPLYGMERGTFRLNGTYRRDSTLQNELSETGLVLSRTQRTWVSVAPTWKGSITEHSTLELQYRFTSVEYADGQTSGLFDFRNHQGTARFSRQLTEKDRIIIAFSYAIYKVPSLDFKQRVFTGRTGVSHRFSETLTVTLLAGGYRSAQRGLEDRRGGFSLYGIAEKRFEQTDISMSVSREIDPSGSGALLQNDHLVFSLRRGLTAELSVSFSANLYKNHFISLHTATRKSRYDRYHSALRRQWTEQWSTTASYSYSRQKTDGSPRSATANAVYVSMTYHWPTTVFSP